VNTSSAVGLFGQQRSSGYGAAKMGIVGMTRVLAIEGASRGIRVNAIAPVGVSDMAGEVYGPLTPKLDPALVASAVVALAHESCPLTGQVVSAGGGRIARIRIDAEAGLFDPALDVEAAAGYLAGIPPNEPGSAMEEIDLIRVNFPELTEPMRYPGP
jgi:NAD(P)-dependent dehydrogenase (short-subunit alcohol dehydrogenase family)